MTARRPAFFSSRLKTEPYDVYAAVLGQGDLHHSPTGVWVAGAQADATAILTDPRFSSAGWVGEAGDDERARRLFGPRRFGGAAAAAVMRRWLIFLDGSDHGRQRRALVRSLAARLPEVRERLGQIVDEVLQQVSVTPTADLVDGFARAVPRRVACALLDVPPEDEPTIGRWSSSAALALEPFLPRADVPRVEADLLALDGYLSELVRARARVPRDNDLLTDLLRAPEGLDDAEVAALGALVLAASQETTASLLASASHLLLTHEEVRRHTLEHGGWERVVEEALRMESPIQMVLRRAIEPVEIHGRPLEPGDYMLVVLGAANRDKDIHVRGEDFAPSAARRRHIAFGAGAHACPGAPLAQAEAVAALRALFERFPNLALHEPPTWRPLVGVRSLRSLVVTFG